MALNLFQSKVDAIKVDDGSSSKWFIGDKLNADLTASAIGNGNYLFDPKTGKAWSSDGSNFTEVTETLPAGSTTGAVLVWNGSAWVEDPSAVITAGSLDLGTPGSEAGSIVLSGSTSGSATIATNATASEITTPSVNATGSVTASTDVTATTGNISATAGSVSAGTTVTAGTGLVATTGGLTVTAGASDINGSVNISGAVVLDGAAANSITLQGTTNTVDLAGSGAHELQMGGTTNTVDLNGTGAQSIEMAGTTNTITLAGSGNAEIAFAAGGTNKISGLDNPTAADEAANKAYVDAVASGLSVKENAKWATTSNLPTNTTSGAGIGKTITLTGLTTWSPDGTAVVNGDRVLVRSYGATGSESTTNLNNGIYSVSGVGTEIVLTRITPYDEPSEITDGSFFFVTDGSTYANTGWVQTQVITTVDTTPIAFSQFSAAGVVTLTSGASIDVGSAPNYNVALDADLDTGATGFTISDTRIPYATSANTLGSSAALTYVDSGGYQVVLIGDSTGIAGVQLDPDSSAEAGYFLTKDPASNVSSATLFVKSGRAIGTANSGAVFLESGNAQTGNSGIVEITSGQATTGNSGSIKIETGTASGTRGTITLSADANDVKLQNSPTTDTVTGTNLPNVSDVSFIREKVVRRITGTTSATLSSGASAAKFLVYVSESATVKYASEILVTSTDATTGVDFSEYAIIGTGTTPAGLTITASAASAVVSLAVSQTNAGTIVVEAIPLV